MSDATSGDSKDAFHLRDMDKKFPLHWKSGSLKYTDSRPLVEGGTAKLFT